MIKVIVVFVMSLVMISGIASAFPSVETEYVDLNHDDTINMNITVVNEGLKHFEITENYFTVNNLNDRTEHSTNVLYSGTMTGIMIIQRPDDACAREYTHIEQIITSGDETKIIITDLRPLWFKVIIPNELGYDMFYGRTATKTI